MRAHTSRCVYRGKYVRKPEGDRFVMDGPNIALVKFFLSSNVGAHPPLTLFAISIVCAIIPYNRYVRISLIGWPQSARG